METGPRLKARNPAPLAAPAPWYAFLALLVFARVIFTGRYYFDSDLLAQFAPWRDFFRHQLALGHFPLWDPYLLGGQPFLADPQNMMLYPPNYLTLLFPVPLGLSLFLALHWAWAAWGMDAWLGEWGLKTRARRLGALTFALSGFFFMELIHPPVVAAFAWIPWWFARLEAFRRAPGPRNAFLAGLVLALLFLGGSFQVFLGAFYGGLGFSLWRAWNAPPPRKAPAAWASSALFFLLGSLPLWSQWVPTLEFFLRCSRHAGASDYWTFNAVYSMRPGSLVHALFPAWGLEPGQWLDHAVQNDRDFLAVALYLGVWILPLAALAFGDRASRKKAWFFLAAALLTLGTGLGGYFFLHPFLTRWIPGFSDLRAPYRFAYFWTFSLSTLAAMGWQAWEARSGPGKRSGWVFPAAGLWALGLLTAAAFQPTRTLWEILSLLGGLAGIFLAARRKAGPLGPGLLAASLLVPLLFRGWGVFCPAPASNFDFAANSGPITALAAPRLPARVALDPRRVPYPILVRDRRYVSYYPENAFAALRLNDLGGYNPLSLRAVDDLRFLPAQTLFKLMAVGGFFTAEDGGALRGFEKEQAGRLYFYRSLFSGDLVFCPRRWEVLADGESRLRAMAQPAFDPYQEGVLASPLPAEQAARLTGKPADLRYSLERDGAEDRTYRVQLRCDGLVVFSQPAYPGWRARVDGTAAPLLTADHALQALFLPAGTHRVEFTYDPWWKPWLPLPWLACLLAGLWLYRRKP